MIKKPSISIRQNIRSSFRDAIFTNLNIGLAESYFCAFMLALGISEVVSGLGTVIPQFIGVFFQLFSIRSFFRKYSLKKRMTLFLTVQALSLIPLIFIGKFKMSSPYLVIGILGLYWASLLSLNPAWNRLIGHTVPVKFRLKFFSLRSQLAQSSVFVGLVTSGILLYFAKEKGQELPLFVVILTTGFILKCLSIYEVKMNHMDFDLAPGSEVRVRFRDFIKTLKSSDQGKLVSFLFFFYITVHFSAPYFNPYMLGKLKFNYIQYMGITAIAYFGRIFTFRLLQKRAKSRYINKLLIYSTVGIASTPLFWAFSQNYWMILFFEFLSGCYWAGFELSTILLYYQKIEDRERTSIITYISFLNTAGMLIGSSLGAVFMKFLPENFDEYLVLFAVSTFLRVFVLIFAPHVNFKGQIPKLIGTRRILGVIPPFTSLARPFVDKIKKKKE